MLFLHLFLKKVVLLILLSYKMTLIYTSPGVQPFCTTNLCRASSTSFKVEQILLVLSGSEKWSLKGSVDFPWQQTLFFYFSLYSEHYGVHDSVFLQLVLQNNYLLMSGRSLWKCHLRQERVYLKVLHGLPCSSQLFRKLHICSKMSLWRYQKLMACLHESKWRENGTIDGLKLQKNVMSIMQA